MSFLYRTTVLADSPLFYARLDELSGSVITDSSGNGFNGTYQSGVTYGIASPIETDATSLATSGAVGSVNASGILDVRSNFTWEAWGFGEGALICRSGQFGLAQTNVLGFDEGAARFYLYIGGVRYTCVSDGLVPSTWYHLVGVRNGTSMLLYVNGILAASPTTIPSGDIAFAFGETAFFLGRAASANTSHSSGTDEPAIYGTALSSGRVLAHYEAAKASLPLRATITINLGLELNTDQITPTNFGFAHNYSATFGDGDVPIVEELEYKTNVNQSEPDYQQRISARPHGALRTLEYHVSPISGAARARLQGHLYTPGTFYCVPVWSDYGLTTAQATAGASTISCDTTKRDYEALSYCGTCTDPSDPTTYQFFQILSVADAALTLTSTVGTTIPSGSYVFPARVCSISEDTLAVKSFAADHEDTVLRFALIESELSTRRITAYTPSTTYKSTEVFTLETAKVSFLDDRPYDISRRTQAHGRDYQYAMDTGSPQTFPVRFLLTSRSALSNFYGWLDARQGKLNPLFVSTKEKDLIVLARPTSDSLTVQKTGFAFHQGRRHLEFLLNDGTYTRKRVLSVTDNGTTETWTFGAPSEDSLPTLGQIVKVSFLKYCTLAQDIIQIRHWKGQIAESSLSFKELLTSPD